MHLKISNQIFYCDGISSTTKQQRADGKQNQTPLLYTERINNRRDSFRRAEYVRKHL